MTTRVVRIQELLRRISKYFSVVLLHHLEFKEPWCSFAKKLINLTLKREGEVHKFYLSFRALHHLSKRERI
jgi:hypothetical protein